MMVAMIPCLTVGLTLMILWGAATDFIRFLDGKNSIFSKVVTFYTRTSLSWGDQINEKHRERYLFLFLTLMTCFIEYPLSMR